MKQASMGMTHFDWVAPVYDLLARLVFGHKLQEAQTMFLNEIPVGSSILVVGGGTGQLLDHLARIARPKRIVYLDSSARMIALSTERMLKKPIFASVEFCVGDVMTFLHSTQFDVVITPFLLDLFHEKTLRQRLIPQLLSNLKPDGFWLITDFVSTQNWWQKNLLWLMIRFFRITAGIETRQLANWQEQLSQAGLIRKHQANAVNGMVSTEVWQRK